MLDAKACEQLEHNVWERLQLNQENPSGTESLAKMISQIAVRATIVTLQEYERLNNETSE
nr:hypothetical protein [uncultured Acetatifactor sp.]